MKIDPVVDMVLRIIVSCLIIGLVALGLNETLGR